MSPYFHAPETCPCEACTAARVPVADGPAGEREPGERELGFAEGIARAANLVRDDAGLHTAPWLEDHIVALAPAAALPSRADAPAADGCTHQVGVPYCGLAGCHGFGRANYERGWRFRDGEFRPPDAPAPEREPGEAGVVAQRLLRLISEWDDDGDDGSPSMSPAERQMLAGFLVIRGVSLAALRAPAPGEGEPNG